MEFSIEISHPSSMNIFKILLNLFAFIIGRGYFWIIPENSTLFSGLIWNIIRKIATYFSD